MCTENFIGIKHCDRPAPKSGYYINDLEGLTMSAAADIAVESDAVTLFEEKIQFAIKQTVNDACAQMPKLQFNVFVDSLQYHDFSGEQRQGEPSLTITPNKRKSPFSSLVVNTIFVKLGEDYAGDLLITDDGQTVETLPIEAAGGTELCIEGLAVKIKGVLNIRIPDGNLSPFVARKQSFAWESAIADCCSRPWQGLYFDASDGIGIAADVSVVCDEDKLLCRMLHPLKEAILYRAGAEILNEWLATDRVNFLAQNGQEWAQKKKEEWGYAYNAKLKYALGSNMLKTLQKLDPVCFDCAGNKFGYAI